MKVYAGTSERCRLLPIVSAVFLPSDGEGFAEKILSWHIRKKSFSLYKNKIMKFARPYQLILFVFALLALVQCAKRGTPEGGPKDLLPPRMVEAQPDTFSTQFTAKKIRIYFDEFVRLKDVQKQLIISPPMKYFPEVRPQGLPTKFIDILIRDTLLENTTYTMNFGQSVEDNNEANPFSFFKYVFSTGKYIDSLTLSGTIKDALLKVPDNFVSVMLYEVNEKFNDSIIYKLPPTYITSTLDSAVVYNFENMKPGTYFLAALKDKNNNYLYNQKTDKIGFKKEYITLPTDSVYALTLFKEVNTFKALKPTQASANRLIFGYEGSPEKMKIDILSPMLKDFDYRVTADKTKDTLYYWFKDVEADTLRLKVSNEKKIDTFAIPFKKMKKDSLLLRPVYTGTLPLNKSYYLESEIPLERFDKEKIFVFSNDSVPISFEAKLDSIQLFSIAFAKEESQRYNIKLLPGALTDFYEHSNDTLNIKIATKNDRDYGRLNMDLKNIQQFPIIVQLLNNAGLVLAEQLVTQNKVAEFLFLDPMKYTVRIIYDSNGNGKWDTGDYFSKRQPERIEYFPAELDIRANWDVFETFISN